MLLSVPVLATDGAWTPSHGVVYAVFLACVVCHGILASSFSKVMGKLQTAFVVMNFVLIFATIIALPIGRSKTRNDATWIFATTANLTTWPSGWAFMLAWLSPIWVSCLLLRWQSGEFALTSTRPSALSTAAST